MDLLCFRQVDPVGQSPRMGMYGYFTHGTDPPPHLYSLASSLFPTPFADRLPQPTPLPITRSHGFPRASGSVRVSDYSHGIVSHFASAYRVPYPSATRKPCESSWGPALIFHTVPPANTLVRWVNEYAFASIVQARPCPTFGRPVHPRGRPHRLRPGTSPHALRIPPRDGHPALRDTARRWLQVCLGCVRLSPSCPFRLSLPAFSPRPARHYPRFRIWRPSSERQRDFNPPEQRAAQRTLWPLLTPVRSPCAL